ncbi:MAG: ABC transporter permease subunit [Spirochaetaceae bacterium]|jgi:putative aldouronate transport system permease protein|nr:ABC transporter permease subunit [Spirochaetaceae bacterium]
MKRKGFITDIITHPYRYLLLLPATLYTFIYGYCSYPYIVIAFKKFNYRQGVFGSPFNGLQNFAFFFKSSAAANVIGNTVYLNLLFLIFTTICSVALAILLNEIVNRPFKRIAQSFMLFPHYLSWVVIGYMIYGFFSMEYGVINKVLIFFGGKPVNWYAEPEVWPGLLVIMRIWKGAGMSAVIYLASITGIDSSIYEAAEIDGASRMQQIGRLTIPLLTPTVCILTLLSIGRIMYGDFGMMYAIIGDNGVLYSSTDIIDTYIFRALRQTGNPSQAMAISLFQSLIGFGMVFGSNKAAQKLFPEGSLY